jgi:uncharacterized protein YprB with RNaseH-like and TPR domain
VANAKDKRKKFDDLRSQLDRRGYGQERRQRRAADPSTQDIRLSLKHKEERARTKAEASIIYRRDLPRATKLPSSSVAMRGPRVELEKAVDGTEVVCAGKGAGFVTTTLVNDLEGAGAVGSAFDQCLCKVDSDLCTRIAPVYDPTLLTAADVVFMDVESTGLGSSPLFLIGIMVWEHDGFRVKQFLARNYAEEPAVISLFLEACVDKKLLVTFNGKSFDFPYVRTRAIATRVPFAIDPAHLDLLHVCRRIWRRALPDCKLQTLEKHVCGRIRHGDIPGEDIPDAYHAYVRTGDARQIVRVLKHNMLDLVTLADLMTRLPGRSRDK